MHFNVRQYFVHVCENHGEEVTDRVAPGRELSCPNDGQDDQLAVEAGSLEGKVTSLALDMSKNNKIDMVRDESLEKTKGQKI